MTVRAGLALLLAVLLAVSAIEVSTWALGQAVSVVVPSASVSEVTAEVPHAPELDAPAQATAPAFTW